MACRGIRACAVLLVSYMPLAQCGRKILQCEPVRAALLTNQASAHVFASVLHAQPRRVRIAALIAPLHTLQAASLDARRRRRTAQINR